MARCWSEAELLIDAVVGTGFKPPLRGLAAALREMVEGLMTPVVAVDLPSGWDADSMEQSGGGGVSRGCGGDVYGAEDGACVWASDAGADGGRLGRWWWRRLGRRRRRWFRRAG